MGQDKMKRLSGPVVSDLLIRKEKRHVYIQSIVSGGRTLKVSLRLKKKVFLLRKTFIAFKQFTEKVCLHRTFFTQINTM